MTARKKPAVEPVDDGREFTVTPAMLKWGFGVMTALLGAFILWTQAWEKIDSRWRLESIQKANDAKVSAEISAIDKKAVDALSDHVKADNRSRTWTLFVIQDFRAAAETRWAEECVDKKRPADVCRELDRKATESRARAAEMRSKAMEASKETP